MTEEIDSLDIRYGPHAAEEIRRLRSEIDHLKSDLWAERQETQAAMDQASDVEAMQSQVERLRAEIDRLKAALAHAEGDRVAAFHANSAAADEIADMEAEIKRLEAERDHAVALSDLSLNQRDERIAEVERLRASIREHRDQKSDDRCWLDDMRLYNALDEGPEDCTLPPKCEFLKSCERYWEQRQSPGEKHTASADKMTIGQLEREIDRLRASQAAPAPDVSALAKRLRDRAVRAITSIWAEHYGKDETLPDELFAAADALERTPARPAAIVVRPGGRVDLFATYGQAVKFARIMRPQGWICDVFEVTTWTVHPDVPTDAAKED